MDDINADVGFGNKAAVRRFVPQRALIIDNLRFFLTLLKYTQVVSIIDV